MIEIFYKAKFEMDRLLVVRIPMVAYQVSDTLRGGPILL
jgi:hypothetical protein